MNKHDRELSFLQLDVLVHEPAFLAVSRTVNLRGRTYMQRTELAISGYGAKET